MSQSSPWSREQKVATKEDGLSAQERNAYKACLHHSCANEACVKRYMYRDPRVQKEKCSALMDRWQQCYDEQMAKTEKPAE